MATVRNACSSGAVGICGLRCLTACGDVGEAAAVGRKAALCVQRAQSQSGRHYTDWTALGPWILTHSFLAKARQWRMIAVGATWTQCGHDDLLRSSGQELALIP
eukprot:12790467-Alexandrium_andersonii.AAC.1